MNKHDRISDNSSVGAHKNADAAPQPCSIGIAVSAGALARHLVPTVIRSGSTQGRTERNRRRVTERRSRSAFSALMLAMFAFSAIAPNHACAREPELHFGIIGDWRYFPEHWIDRVFEDVTQDHSLAFVVHLGGLAGPGLACTDKIRRRRLVQFDRSSRPFIYTPGHADWADCLNEDDGQDPPLTILSKLRNTFFNEQRSGWPANMGLVSQGRVDAGFARYHENWRWQISNVTFMSLHVIGNNNNLGRSPETDQEFAVRTSANLAWLRAGFEYAGRHRSRAVVLLMQADLFRTPSQSPTRRRPSGYFRLRDAVDREARLFAKPVMIVHGEMDDDPRRDGQIRPLSEPENIVRAGAFSTPRQNWIRATVFDQPTSFKLARQQLDLR